MGITFLFVFWILVGLFIGFLVLFALLHLNEQEINSLRTANRRLRHHAYQAWGEAREAQKQLDIITGELKRRRESNG